MQACAIHEDELREFELQLVAGRERMGRFREESSRGEVEVSREAGCPFPSGNGARSSSETTELFIPGRGPSKRARAGETSRRGGSPNPSGRTSAAGASG